MTYDYIERYGYCQECDAAWYISENVEGCSSQYCDLFVPAHYHED